MPNFVLKRDPFLSIFSHCAWERQVTEELFFASIKNASLLREVRVNTRDVMTEAYHHIFRENGSQNPIKTNNQASKANAAFAVRQHVFKNRFKTLLDFMEKALENQIFWLGQHTPKRDPRRHVFLSLDFPLPIKKQLEKTLWDLSLSHGFVRSLFHDLLIQNTREEDCL